MRVMLVLLMCVAGSAVAEYAEYRYVPPASAKSAARSALSREAVASRLRQDYPTRVFTTFEAKNGELAAEEHSVSEVASGFPLDLSGADLFGEGVLEDGQWVFMGGILSLDAHALRLLVNLEGLAAGDELWLLDPKGLGAYGPFTAEGKARWLPVVQGDTAVLMLRSGSGEMPELRLEGVSHFFVPLGGPEKSAACPTPVACDGSSVVQEVSTGIALLIIPSGFSQVQCTGALINHPATPDSPASLMLTAGHCFSGTVDASQVEVVWDYRAADCQGEDAPDLSDLPQSAGKAVLARDSVLDGTLFELEGAVPNGAYGRAWLGWDTRVPVLNDSVMIIQHPSTTPMKIAYGHVTGVDVDACLDLLCINQLKKQTEVHWYAGITAGGASGAPLLMAGMNYRIGGMLSNGVTQTCGDTANNLDNFASFRDFFSEVACYLTPDEPCGAALTADSCPAIQVFGKDSSEVASLRRFRDKVLMKSTSGQSLTRLYYRVAPGLTRAVDASPGFRMLFRMGVRPFIDVGKGME